MPVAARAWLHGRSSTCIVMSLSTRTRPRTLTQAPMHRFHLHTCMHGTLHVLLICLGPHSRAKLSWYDDYATNFSPSRMTHVYDLQNHILN